MSIRNLIRRWLGIPSMEEARKSWDAMDDRVTSLYSNSATSRQLAAFESHWNADKVESGESIAAHFNTLHLEMQKARIELVNLLSDIDKRITNQHLDQPRTFVEPVYDWETVQRMELQEMMANPPKE